MERRLELDAARGLMLLWITLTHLPTVASTYVNQPFGFFSAAEGFIFLSALFTGRIYSRIAARFCTGYRVLTRISSADDSDEGGQPIARCTLRGTLAQVWPSIVATQQN